MEILALLTGGRWWKLYSLLIKVVLKGLYGIEVGREFFSQGTPKLRIRGKGSSVRIGNNVKFLGPIDLRNREEGKIIFEDRVVIEEGCRFVSAREGTIRIGEGTVIGANSVFNGGGDILIGKQCIFAVGCSVNANDHQMKKNIKIRGQGFLHAPVIIEDDCWFGAHVAVNKGVVVSKGTVIGANAVVTKDTEPYSINVGVPAAKIGERE